MSYATLKYFDYAHLPERLRDISRPFSDLANDVVDRGGDPQEVAACLRKLLEAKDCAVRAAL